MIRSERQGDILVLTLDRPQKRNALSVEMLDALLTHLHLASNGLRVLLLQGTGETFCSGFDLSACRDDPAALARLLTSLYTVIAALRGLPCPVVIAAHGAAIAGGCALLCAADFVVTHDDARLGYPVVRLGISPAVNAPFLRNAIGDSRTRELLLEGALIDGAAALACGLASHTVRTPQEVIPAALALARTLAEKPPLAMAETRRWLNELEGSDDAAQMGLGLSASLAIVGNPEQNERLAKLWAR